MTGRRRITRLRPRTAEYALHRDPRGMDEFVDEADTLSVTDPTLRDVTTLRDIAIDDTDVLVIAAPRRVATDSEWPPDPAPPAPPAPRPRRARMFPAITESKLR